MSAPSADPPQKPSWTVSQELAWVFAAGLAGAIGAWALVAENSRRPHRTIDSQNDAKHQALAVTNYHMGHDAFPPYGGDAALDAPPVAWMTAILPQMDERALHSRIDFQKPFDAPANAAVFSKVVRSYTSPFVGDAPLPSGLAPAHYAGNELVFVPGLTLDAIGQADGLTQTIMLAEVNAATGAPTAWGDPDNLRSAAAPTNGPTGFGANGPGGGVVGFCDGRVTNFNPDMDPAVLAALGTPDGGEAIDAEF
ncbi:DUF1559 family PulG-like putative transporter [Alienimonas californiensis]|uniref:DUF1559 domain-containing protein n=1 Tax=Alienimonas californiensis TaxID=2527989 RepID=A0A517P7S1_9PLAN|nr:DUF1559 domain-containing protein [Alienimonas californiensis]QDT15403.1 hypothetical protein CA12_14880 [Alienimonas californiensis]